MGSFIHCIIFNPFIIILILLLFGLTVRIPAILSLYLVAMFLNELDTFCQLSYNGVKNKERFRY